MEKMTSIGKTQTRGYEDKLYNYVSEELERSSRIRDHKETVTYTGFAIFIAACSQMLFSEKMPMDHFTDNKWIASGLFFCFWLVIYIFLRRQLKVRRWAALRVAGCNWFLGKYIKSASSEHVSDSISKQNSVIDNGTLSKLSWYHKLIDLFFPLDKSVEVLNKQYDVYPKELKYEWNQAEARGTGALFNERIVIASSWAGCLLVIYRILSPN